MNKFIPNCGIPGLVYCMWKVNRKNIKKFAIRNSLECSACLVVRDRDIFLPIRNVRSYTPYTGLTAYVTNGTAKAGKFLWF